MLSTRLQSFFAPRYPRRYIGRHRARLTIRFITSVPAQRRSGSAKDRAAA